MNTLTARERAERQELFDCLDSFKTAVPSLFVTGPDYARTVVTHWEHAVFCTTKGDLDSARRFYRLALAAAEDLA